MSARMLLPVRRPALAAALALAALALAAPGALAQVYPSPHFSGLTVDNQPIFAACSGYMFGNGAAPAGCATTIPAAALAGTIANARLPVPTLSALGGVEAINALSHNWIAYIDGSGLPHLTQPALGDLAGIGTNVEAALANPLDSLSPNGVSSTQGMETYVGALSLTAYYNSGSSSTVNAASFQAALDANPTATFTLPPLPAAACYMLQGPIYLSDSTGRDFSGTIRGLGGCITWTNAGNATDAEIATQRGFVSYPRTNGAGGDVTGASHASIIGTIETCPAHGTCIHIANAINFSVDKNQFSGGRWQVVLETNIDADISNNNFQNYINGGLGFLMLDDTARVYYGSNPFSSYWNDAPTISGNTFDGNTSGGLGNIVDMGSESESTRIFIGNSVDVGSGANIYGYLSRNASPTFVGANWFEGVEYPIRTLTNNSGEGGGNIAGVTAAEPAGTYALSNFPNGYSYSMTVIGNFFTHAINDINCTGISGGGSCMIGQNQSFSNTGYHVVTGQTGSNVVDTGDSYSGSGAYKSISYGTYTPLNAGALSIWSCTLPDSGGTGVYYCPWKAANSASRPPTFDDFSVTYNSTCSTTYPVVSIYDITQSSALGSTTVPNTNTTVTSVNAAVAGAGATDQYGFRVTTAGVGCSTTLATEFIYLTATLRQ